MGFEFNGTPPAWLAGSGTLKSFAATTPTAAPPNGNHSSQLKSAGSNMEPSAGGFPFQPSAHPNSQPTPSAFSFGNAPAQGAKGAWNTMRHGHAVASTSGDAAPATTNKDANEPLHKALRRAARGQRAAIGDLDIAADGILSETLKANGICAETLLQALCQSPELATFTQALFDKLVRGQARSGNKVASPKPPPPTVENMFTKPDMSKKKIPKASKLPDRDHPVYEILECDLANRIFALEISASKERARVLAAFVHTQIRQIKDDKEMVAIVADLLGRARTDHLVVELVNFSYVQLGRVKSIIADPPSQPEHSLEADVLRNEAAGDHDANFQILKAFNPAKALPTQPFRFLDLPAELRNWVYAELLVSKTGYLSTKRLRDLGTFEGVKLDTHYSGCHTAILAACKQIHKEAKDILYQENIIIATVTASIGTGSTLHRGNFPLSMLPRLSHVVLAVDSVAHGGPFQNDPPNYARLNWTDFQSFTGLKTLRICNVERTDQGKHIDHLKHKNRLLKEMIERIPAGCAVSFGSQEGVETQYVQGVIDRDNQVDHVTYYRLKPAAQVDGEMLKKCSEGIKQGVKSGDEQDYFFKDRSMKLKSLVKEGEVGEIDPKYVFGAGA